MKKMMWMTVLAVLLGLQGFMTGLEAAELKFSGDFRVRGIYSDNLYDADEVGDDQEAFADGRFRMKIAATAGITTGIVVVDFSNAFGDPTNTGCGFTGCDTGNYRFGTANFGGDYRTVGVREAHLKLDFGESKLAFGRKQFRLGHSLILDDTMDAIAGKIESGEFDAMVAFGKLMDRNQFAPGHTGGDSDLYIAKVGFSHGGPEGATPSDTHRIGLFSAYLKDRQPFFVSATEDSQIWVVGVTADGRLGPIEAEFEVDTLGGERNNTATPNVNISGLNFLLGGKVDLGPSSNIGLTFLHTRGDEGRIDEDVITGISGNYVLGNILVNDNLLSDREGQCANVGGGRIGSGAAGCGFGGLGITAVKLAANLPDMTPECDLDVAVIWAKATEKPLGTGERDLGVELDLNMTHQIDEHLNATVNLGYLFAGDIFKVLGGPGDNIMKAVASLNYTF